MVEVIENYPATTMVVTTILGFVNAALLLVLRFAMRQLVTKGDMSTHAGDEQRELDNKLAGVYEAIQQRVPDPNYFAELKAEVHVTSALTQRLVNEVDSLRDRTERLGEMQHDLDRRLTLVENRATPGRS